MNAPTVTCVIPTFRRPAFLKRAIRSVLNQSYPHIRVRVFDNASGDETASVAKEAAAGDPRVEYFCHSSNLGALANFAHGIAQVDTPLFSVLGDDDILLPNLYSDAVAALSRVPDAMFYAAPTVIDHKLFDMLRYAPAGWASGLHEPGVETIVAMIRHHFPSTGVVCRREIEQSVGKFAEYASDKSFMIIAAATHPFVTSDKVSALFTIHESSFSGGVATNDRGAQNASFAIQILRETSAGLEKRGIDVGRSSHVGGVLRRNTLREVLYSVLFQSLPRGGWSAIDKVLESRDELALSRLIVWPLVLLRVVGRIPFLRSLVSFAIDLLTRRVSHARAARERDVGLERRIRAYVDSGCTRPDILAS